MHNSKKTLLIVMGLLVAIPCFAGKTYAGKKRKTSAARSSDGVQTVTINVLRDIIQNARTAQSPSDQLDLILTGCLGPKASDTSDQVTTCKLWVAYQSRFLELRVDSAQKRLSLAEFSSKTQTDIIFEFTLNEGQGFRYQRHHPNDVGLVFEQEHYETLEAIFLENLLVGSSNRPQPQVDINILSDSELNQLLLPNEDSSNQDPSFSQKLQALTSQMTWVDLGDKGYYQAWIVTPPKTQDGSERWLSFRIEEKAFSSEVLKESELMRITGQEKPQSPRFLWFILQEYIEARPLQPLVDIWIDNSGTFGELKNLLKGQTISGTELLSFANKLRNFFNPSFFLLHDDSKLSLQSPNSSKPTDVFLRMLYPLLSSNGGTWYQTHSNYQALDFRKIDRIKGGALEYQNHHVLRAAIRSLRDLTLKSLLESVFHRPSFSKRKETVVNLINLHFRETIEQGEFRSENHTIRELLFKVFQAAKNSQNPTATKNLCDLYHVLFDFKILLKPGTNERALRNFVLAVRVLEWHRVFFIAGNTNDVRLIETSRDFNSFLSFEQIIDEIPLNIASWEDTAPLLLAEKND